MKKMVKCNMADKCLGPCNHKELHKRTDSCKDYFCKSEKKYGVGCIEEKEGINHGN
jgi:hypothetical protein